MKPISLVALLVCAVMLTPSLAEAARKGDGYKPRAEKGVKKKVNKNKIGGKKAAARKNKKVVKKKKKAKKVVKSRARSAIVHKPRKKSKSRKFKRLLKKSLKVIGEYSLQDAYGAPRRGVRARGPYHYGRSACLPKPLIRARLIDRGWHNFELINRRPNRVRLRATNFKGRRFHLVIDRCHGHIIKKRPVRQYWGYRY